MAHAQGDSLPGMVSIAWNAPESCPGEKYVQASVASVIGRSNTLRHAAALKASGTVNEVEGHFHLRVQLDSPGASETKRMDADTCETLAEAFAFVVAFTLDLSPGVSDVPVAAAPPEIMTTQALARESPEPSRRRSPTQLFAGPVAAVGAGMLPFPAYGAGALLAVETGPRWELAGVWWPERSSSSAAGAPRGVGASVWLAMIEPSACLPFGRVVAACVGGELGNMHGRGTGVTLPGDGASWWLALTAGIAVSTPVVSGIDVRFRLDAGLPFVRPTFVLENVDASGPVQAFHPSPAFAALTIEPDFRFFSTDRAGVRHVPD
jgi:hypothetical protein